MKCRANRSWTDEQLKRLVASSTTWAAVLRGLGLAVRGRNHHVVRTRVKALGLDTAHFNCELRRSEDARIREAVARSATWEETARLLGIESDPHALAALVKRAREIGTDSTHLQRRRASPARRKRRRWTDDQLRAAVAGSFSMAATLRALGLIAAGGNYESLQRRIKELGIDTSHFRGKAWNSGLRYQPAPARPLEQLLVGDRWMASHHLKGRLFRAGLKAPTCELCGWAEVAPDGRIPVELDHINGDRNDNRLENLRILCPNCHSLQATHRGLNQRRSRK